jgi:phosphatidylglycerophosphate synthase
VTIPGAERARLDLAVKQDDSPFTTFLVSPWSKYVAWAAARRGLSPNQVTTASLGVALLAAGCCATGERWGYVTGAVLLQASFGLDCADGQLARFTGAFSALGGWLDAMFDRLKEYAVYVGLAVGSARSGDDVWALAVAALVLQTVRHVLDSAWSVTPASVSALAEGARRREAGRRRRWHWLRKVAILPIGERWLLISLLTAFTTPRVVLVVLVAAGAVATAYMIAARVRRSLRPAGTATGPPDAAAHEASLRLDALRGTGPAAALLARRGPAGRSAAVALPVLGAGALALALGVSYGTGSAAVLAAGALAFAVLVGLGGRRSPDPRWGWVVPPLLRAGEYATVVVAARVSGAGVGALSCAYLLVLVWHHYDFLYRLRHAVGGPVPAGSSPPEADRLGGGELRTVAVAVLAAAGAGAWTAGVAGATGVLVVLAVARGLDGGRRSGTAEAAPAGRGDDR